MELWSLYDENGIKIIAEHDSQLPIPEGMYHISIEVLDNSSIKVFFNKACADEEDIRGILGMYGRQRAGW